MSLLQKIKLNFQPVEKFLEAPAEPDSMPTQQPPAIKQDAHCEHNDWWLPVGSDSTSRASQPRCWVCQPPSSRNLVGQKFFLDDAGNRWIIDQQPDGSEVWTKDDINVQQQH